MASTPAMTVAQLLRAEADAAHQMMEGTMADVDAALAALPAPGRANPIGASYAHAILTEDTVVNGMLRGRPPLWVSAWEGRTGTDRPVVINGSEFPGAPPGDLGAWYRDVRVDLGACRAYARAVYADTAAFLDGADAATLARPIDLSFIGMGAMPTALAFGIFVTGHVNNLCGEISAIKGAHGRKGYPV